LLECKAGSGTPLYLMMQKRQETEVYNQIESKAPFLFYSDETTRWCTISPLDWPPLWHLAWFSHSTVKSKPYAIISCRT